MSNKEMFELNDDMLDDVVGGATPPDLDIKSDEQLLAQYETFKAQYKMFIKNGLDKSTNQAVIGQFNDIVDTLEHIEAELSKRGLPFSRDN